MSECPYDPLIVVPRTGECQVQVPSTPLLIRPYGPYGVSELLIDNFWAFVTIGVVMWLYCRKWR